MVRLAWPPEAQENLAGTLDADWFVHHEGDEFRESAWPNERLVDGIARADTAGYNAIDFELLNFYPADNAWREGKYPRPVLRGYQPGAPWDKVQIKCWKKTPGVDLVSSGGDEARFENRRVVPFDFSFAATRYGRTRTASKVSVKRRPRWDPVEGAMGGTCNTTTYCRGTTFCSRRLDCESSIRIRFACSCRCNTKISRVSWQPDPTTPHDLKAPRCLAEPPLK